MLYKQGDYFFIGNIFVYLTIYFLVIPFVFSGLDFRAMLALPIFFIGFFSFFIGLKTEKYFKVGFIGPESKNSHKRLNLALSIVALLFLSVDIYNAIFVVLKVVENQLNYTSRYFLESNYSALYLQILALIFLYTKFYFYAVLMSRSKIYYYLIFLIQIILYSTSQVRLVALR